MPRSCACWSRNSVGITSDRPLTGRTRIWSESFATLHTSFGLQLAVGPTDDILIAMDTYGQVDFGGGAVGTNPDIWD